MQGTADLPGNRFMRISYESLVAKPVEVIEQLYGRLELGDFGAVSEAIATEAQRRKGYQAKGSLPSESWQRRIRDEWASVVAEHAATA